MSTYLGQPLDRVDGPDKVTGRARFTTDLVLPGMVHGAIVPSTIARGRVTSFDFAEAERVPGVLGFLTHHNALRLHQRANGKGPWVHSGIQLTLQDDRVRFDRQPVAVAIAETLAAAIRAAALVHVSYEVEAPRVSFECEFEHRFNPGSFLGEPADFEFGDFAAGWSAADLRIEATYTTPAEHHNPLEPHNTIARWDGEALEVYDSTQFVVGVRERLSGLLGLPSAKIRVISKYIGGGFGSKGQTWPHVMLAVMAAKLVGRPVHLTVSREQLFGVVGFRSLTLQHVRLGATREGKLVAHSHESTSQTSEFAEFVEPIGRTVAKMYACPNVSVRQRLVRLNTNTPTFMRAPGDSTGLYALECAMDELAYTLEMDPLALRLANYTDVEPGSGRPWSTKGLRACYEKAAARFGWERRPLEPCTLRDGHLQIGWGMASASLHTARARASARVTLHSDATARVESATHDLGTGTYTILSQIAAEALGLAPDRIQVVLGDTALPEAPLSAGSQTAASVGPVVREAALAVRAELIRLATTAPGSPLYGRPIHAIELVDGRLGWRGEPGVPLAELLDPLGRAQVTAERTLEPESEDETAQAMRSFGCHFAEVQVDPELGTVRLSRYVGAFAAGRPLNAKTARSQLIGGVVWGIGMALTEEAVRDPRRGRVMNANLASYLLPVHADVPDLEVLLLEEADPALNNLGAKGLGELGISGVAAAIANAVFHATGKRVRELPLRPDRLL